MPSAENLLHETLVRVQHDSNENGYKEYFPPLSFPSSSFFFPPTRSTRIPRNYARAMKSNCATHASWPFLNFVVGHHAFLKTRRLFYDEMMHGGRRRITRNANQLSRLQMAPRAPAPSVFPPAISPSPVRLSHYPDRSRAFYILHGRKWYSFNHFTSFTTSPRLCVYVDWRIRRTMKMKQKRRSTLRVSTTCTLRNFLRHRIIKLIIWEEKGFKKSNSRNWIYTIKCFRAMDPKSEIKYWIF